MSELFVEHNVSLRGKGKYSDVFKEYVKVVQNQPETCCLAEDRQGRPWRTDRLDAQVLAHTAKHLKLAVSLVSGDDPLLQELNPRGDVMGFGTWASFHPNYDFNESELRESWFDDWDEMYQYIMAPDDKEFSEYLGEGMGALAALPVYMFDHSGLSFSTGEFSCRWDSGQIGFIYATKGDIKNWDMDEQDIPAIKAMLREAIEVYDQWQRGELWEYCVYVSTESLAVGEETLDAVSGFFSNEACREQGQESLQQFKDGLYKRVREQISLP